MAGKNWEDLMRSALISAGAAALACTLVFPAAAQEAFYKGKTIDIIVGYTVDNSFDTYARMMARVMSRYLPGSPNIVVQNMPGAGSMRATNHLYNIAAKDGTVLGVIDQAMPLNQLLKLPGLQADIFKFNWIGRFVDNSSILYARGGAAVKKADDLFTKELIAATPGVSSRLNYLALNTVAQTKIKMITGYDGSSSARLALERGEIDALTQPWPAVRTEYASDLKAGKINLILQADIHKHPELQQVPRMMDLAKDEEGRKILELFSSSADVGRALMAPPGLPPQRVAELRAAFMKSIADPDFKAEANKAQLDLAPMSGEDLQAMLAGMQYPPGLLDRAREIAARAGN
jgi:tripartite-type tricarboxylate transporter receptor subunit TctC